jgi:hypothetical protein
MAKLTMKEWLSRMEMNRHFMENVRSLRRLPASEGRFSNFPDWIHPKLRLVLEKRGIRQLFRPPGRSDSAREEWPSCGAGDAHGQR